jgi:Family of unknown function (DUF5662)
MKAHISYLNYVMRHKWFVFLACIHCQVGLWRALIHDWSKFMPVEWGPYVRSFYNRDGGKRDWKTRDPWEKMEFDNAWNHHQKVNKHHWQYWLLTNDSDEPKVKPLPMPDKYIREMIADWWGAGRAITGVWDAWAWYQKNKDRIILEESTRTEVEIKLWLSKRYFLKETELPSTVGYRK